MTPIMVTLFCVAGCVAIWFAGCTTCSCNRSEKYMERECDRLLIENTWLRLQLRRYEAPYRRQGGETRE